jgi:hypothetical protein
MWCDKKCSAKGKTPSFNGVFTVFTPHIIWRSQCFEKAHDTFLRGSFVPSLKQWSFATGQGLGFHFKIAFRVEVGGLQGHMPQPDADRVDVDAGTQQVHGTRPEWNKDLNIPAEFCG